MDTGCKSTDAGIERFIEHYGVINMRTVCHHLGYSERSWYGYVKKKLNSNYYYSKIFDKERLKFLHEKFKKALT